MINNVVIVSGRQQRDSAIHTHVSILPQTPLPSRLPHNTKQSSLCYTVDPCWLSILNTAVCTCWASLVAQLVKNPPAMRETWVQTLGWEDPLEEGKAIHSSILAWRSPWTL